MPNFVFKEEEITLQDGTDVTLRPLPIGKLKRFMDAWNKFSEVEDDSAGFDVFINCSGVALEENYRGQFDSLRPSKEDAEAGAFLSAEYKEHLEEILDLETIYKILEVCGQIKLNDPKLMEAVAEMNQQQQGE